MEHPSKACVLLLLLLAVAAPSLQTRDIQLNDDDSSFVDHGYAEQHRRLLQGRTVTVGYDAAAPYKVKAGGDALPALTAATAALKRTGGTIKIQSGAYTLSTQWVLVSGSTTVQGAGKGSTILKLKGNAPRFEKAGFVRFTGLKNMVFAGFTIDGNKANQKTTSASAMEKSSITYGRYCFYADGFTNLKFRQVRTQNCQGYGFDPHGIKFKPLIFSRGIDIQDCESFDNGWDGFTIDQIIGGTIANNLARGNGRHGFNIVTGTTGVTVSGNTAENNGFGKGKEKSGNGCGYVVNDNFSLGTKNIKVINNLAKNNNKAGVCVLDAVNVRIDGNTINGANYCGHFAGKKLRSNVFSNNKCISTPKKVFVGQGASAAQVKITGNTGL